MKRTTNLFLLIASACLLTFTTSCDKEEEDDYELDSYTPGGQSNSDETQENKSYKLTVNASYAQAEVTTGNVSSCEFYYSTSETSNFKRHSYIDSDGDEQTECYQHFTVKGLEPGTTYYCYIKNGRQKSETVTFQTKPLDLSGVDVKATKANIQRSYINQYGQTVDLSWMGKEYTFKITSNLGNKCKYGVFGIKSGDLEKAKMYMNSDMDDNYIFYSSSESSPYSVNVMNCPDAENSEASAVFEEDMIQVASILDRINRGEATDDDYEKVEALLREMEYCINSTELSAVCMRAFVEIEGERIYVGSFWK